jgi:hypothetical protein
MRSKKRSYRLGIKARQISQRPTNSLGDEELAL